MLMPKRTKYRRPHRVKYEGKAKGGKTVAFGDFGLVALDGAWITSRQIEAARIAINRHMNRGGKVWIRIFPHLAKKGRVMFEVGQIDEATAREALRLASHKLPVRCKIIGRGE